MHAHTETYVTNACAFFRVYAQSVSSLLLVHKRRADLSADARAKSRAKDRAHTDAPPRMQGAGYILHFRICEVDLCVRLAGSANGQRIMRLGGTEMADPKETESHEGGKGERGTARKADEGEASRVREKIRDEKK